MTELGESENPNYVEVRFSANIAKSKAIAENFEVSDQIGIYIVELDDQQSVLQSSDNLVDNRQHSYNNEGKFVASQPVRCNPDKSYDYFAYYPYNEGNTDAKKIKFSVKSDQSGHSEFTKSDFLYSKLASYKGQNANLQFDHKLSLLKFNLQLQGEISAIDKIKMTILNVGGSVNVDLTDGTVVTVVEEPTSIVPKISGTAPTTTVVAEAIVAPQTLKAGVTLFIVTIEDVTYVYKPASDITTTSGNTREFNVTLSGGSVLDVVVFPEMKTYLTEGLVAASLIDKNSNSKSVLSANVVVDGSNTKLMFIDNLNTGEYTIESIKYADGTVKELGAYVNFVEGTASLTPDWYDELWCFGKGTNANPYILSNGEQLRRLATAVNGSNTFENKYIELSKDVNLGKEQWTPIGNKSKPFKGNFDGKNFEISGLYIFSTTASDHFKGFFGYVDGVGSSNKSVLNNIHFVSSAASGQYDIRMSEGTNTFYVGSLAGCIKNNVVVENCTSSLKIFANSSTGGIIGGTGCDLPIIKGTYANGKEYANVTVKNCHFSGAMQLIGAWLADGAAGMVGGIVGRNHGLVERCSNSGRIVGSSNYQYGFDPMGGIVGGNGGTVKECYNTGTLAAGGTGKYAVIAAGGIVGMPLASGVTNVMLKSYIADCYNTGNIAYVGASCGGILGKINTGNQVGSQLDRCYSVGVMASKKGGIVGNCQTKVGLFDVQFCISTYAGYHTLGSNDYTIFTKPGTRNPTTGGTTGLDLGNLRFAQETLPNMMKKERYQVTVGTGTPITWDWDFDTVWDIDESSSYPTLRNNQPK